MTELSRAVRADPRKTATLGDSGPVPRLQSLQVLSNQPYPMEFRDYAAKETAALFSRLLASQAEASVQHLRSLRDALDAASRGIEDGAASTAGADEDVQELIRRLNTASGTAARVTAQKVQKEAQAVARGRSSRTSTRSAPRTSAWRACLPKSRRGPRRFAESSRRKPSAPSPLDRDLDAAIEAHAHVDAARLEAEAEVRKQTAARADVGKGPRREPRAARRHGRRRRAPVGRARRRACRSGRTARATWARSTPPPNRRAPTPRRRSTSAHEELRGERERGERLTASLAEVQAQADVLLTDLAEAETQAEGSARLAEAHDRPASRRTDASARSDRGPPSAS